MSMNGREVRDISRILHVSTATVIQELKKDNQLSPVNLKLLEKLNPEQMEVDIIRIDEMEKEGIKEAELDEMS